MKIKISKNPNTNWENNSIQFPRLIAEMEAIGIFANISNTFIHELCSEMDITKEDLFQLVNRAQNVWDNIKEQTKENTK